MRRLGILAAAVTVLCAAPSATATSTGQPPGATNPAVTQATLATTICRSGYTKTVRNVSNLTKSQVYAAYGIPQAKKRLYVIDHLIPLEVGGSNSTSNLWPQLKADAKRKDVVENLVHLRLCGGVIDLATAQRVFLVSSAPATTAPPPAATAAPATTAPPETTPPETAPETAPPAPPDTEAPVAPGGGATARCNDGTYSYAEHHQGACSSHGGVAEFYK